MRTGSDVNQSDEPTLIGVRFDAGTNVDIVLGDVARHLARRGLNVAGLIQTRGAKTAQCSCREMRLHDLATGQVTIISENRGPAARGCHLDWQALTDVAVSLEENLTTDTDVLIINRFGRSESEGRGLRGVIEKALTLGVAVVVAYRDEYEDGWHGFHDGLAQMVGPDCGEILGRLNPSAHQQRVAS